jgi:nickel and cobalt resistance protein CnrR
VTPFQRQLAITVVMAGVAGFAGVWFGVSKLERVVESTAPPPLRVAVDELTHRGLVGLTIEQKDRIGQIEQRYAHQRTQLRARIATANVELANSLSEEMSFGPSVEKSIDDLKSAVGDLQKATVQYVLDLRAVLTPQQQAVFDEKVVAALMTEPR